MTANEKRTLYVYQIEVPQQDVLTISSFPPKPKPALLIAASFEEVAKRLPKDCCVQSIQCLGRADLGEHGRQ